MPTSISQSAHEVSREEIRARLGDPSLTIVDVLPAEAYASGHIAGALNLPVMEIHERARRLLPDLKQEIVVYCGGFT